MRLRHVLLAAMLLGSVLPAQACRMTMALEQWPPYLYRDAQGNYTGLDLELLRAIFKEARCTLLTAPELPTARRQLLFQKGGLDLMLAASDTSERHAYARFSVSYRDETVGIFGKAGSAAPCRQLRAARARQGDLAGAQSGLVWRAVCGGPAGAGKGRSPEYLRQLPAGHPHARGGPRRPVAG